MIIRLAIVLLMGMMPALTFADIISAKFYDPTDRYNHGILGDAIEYQTLKIRTNNNPSKGLATTKLVVKSAEYEFKLPIDHVFEDIHPRLADVDGDGSYEVIVIETDVRQGAALAIYDETGKIAETPHIGTLNRWLAPVGIADFNGDGAVDIAYIDRPHLAKMLRIVSYKDGKLIEIANKQGYSNHKIGWDFIASGVRNCNGFVEIITANGNWSQVVSSRMIGDKIVSEKIATYSDPQSIADSLRCAN